MKVDELIKILQDLNQDKEVSIFGDGAERSSVEGIVNADSVVLVSDWSIYRDEGKYQAYTEDKIIYG